MAKKQIAAFVEFYGGPLDGMRTPWPVDRVHQVLRLPAKADIQEILKASKWEDVATPNCYVYERSPEVRLQDSEKTALFTYLYQGVE